MLWHTTDTWPILDPSATIPGEPGFEELAFLQYTSGSTGDPKGVMISHCNLMYNLRSLQMGFRITPEDIAVHWAPQFHDLGLITGILETVFSGSFAALIPPFIFISNPLCLLQAITSYRATMSEQPDFAFNHCVDKITEPDRIDLDLSSLRIFYSGAEPVRKSTFDRFLAAFSPAGLPPECLIPAYGMAEATLMLTGATIPRTPFYLPVKSSALEQNIVIPLLNEDQTSDIQWIASNGKPAIDTSILIVDPETKVIQPSYKVGEIWASGNSISLGYYGNPLISENVLRASPAGQDNPVWLRTGDLGFIYNDELFITGRLKDLIIINGRNFYPQDIEEVVEASHASIRKSCSAAFSIEYNGKERLVVVTELRRSIVPHDTGKIIEDIVSAISREFEIQPTRIALIQKGSVIKTSSGKIMRRANRESLLTGRFEVIADRLFEGQEMVKADMEGGEEINLEQFLVNWVSVRLNNRLHVNPANNLAAYGLDSLRAVELTAETKTIFGFEWPPYLFFEDLSIAQLAVEGMKLMEEI
jgi:acyl-CoA synthetase (AMP-forming)/AMP-acid ligase II/acyl carrier protein